MTQQSEAQEQARLVAYLRGRGWLFTATANGVGTSPVQRSRMAALGVQRGVPDVLVFERCQGSLGIAIELKRASGGTVSPEQRRWVEWLTARGWLAFVARGADEAIARIEEAYGPQEEETT
jgi:hypothetical protein